MYSIKNETKQSSKFSKKFPYIIALTILGLFSLFSTLYGFSLVFEDAFNSSTESTTLIQIDSINHHYNTLTLQIETLSQQQQDSLFRIDITLTPQYKLYAQQVEAANSIQTRRAVAKIVNGERVWLSSDDEEKKQNAITSATERLNNYIVSFQANLNASSERLTTQTHQRITSIEKDRSRALETVTEKTNIELEKQSQVQFSLLICAILISISEGLLFLFKSMMVKDELRLKEFYASEDGKELITGGWFLLHAFRNMDANGWIDSTVFTHIHRLTGIPYNTITDTANLLTTLGVFQDSKTVAKGDKSVVKFKFSIPSIQTTRNNAELMAQYQDKFETMWCNNYKEKKAFEQSIQT